jgi:hypothetical protein
MLVSPSMNADQFQIKGKDDLGYQNHAPPKKVGVVVPNIVVSESPSPNLFLRFGGTNHKNASLLVTKIRLPRFQSVINENG